ncbi:MAG: fibronectin type III domain-containing protein [candidate division Zixibacteria bacterium]|nr:fibronectin type III domain-containing protein [candidate division Zixibacteria bacterium]
MKPDSIGRAISPDSLSPDLYPQAATRVEAIDTPNDAGESISISWKKSIDDYDGGKVKVYRIYRAEVVNGQPGEFKEVGDIPAGHDKYSFQDGNTVDGVEYFYKVLAVNQLRENNIATWEAVSETLPFGPIKSSAQWFDWRRINAFIGVIILSFFIIYFIQQAKSGKELFIRKIAGMEAVDEAVGRATEMGKKIYYVPGLSDMDNMQTIASINILGRVAELSATYETYLEVPVCRSMVMITAKEVVKEAYSKAGRPDTFQEDQVHYLTDDQFGYAAGIDGMVVREKPATIFYMGTFYAESLILAETGNSIGAIQIAGTAMPSQLPFFVAACDYTLIGEELFAASAYLSKEPKLIGSVKGQDIGKGIMLAAIVIGIILETFNIWNFSRLFSVID